MTQQAQHPATAAVHAARLLGKSVTENLWVAELTGPATITIHPPVPLNAKQADEAYDRLQADFPTARVRKVNHDGERLFALFFDAAVKA